MKLEKKHWIIIGVVVAIILVWYFFLRKKKNAESDYRMFRRRRRPALATSVVATMPSSFTMPFKKPLDVNTAVSTPLATFKCPDGFVWTGPSTGCVHKDVLNPPTT